METEINKCAEENLNKERLKVLSETFDKITKTDDHHEHFKLIKEAKDKIGDPPNNSKNL